LGSLGTVATSRPIVPTPVGYDDAEIGGMTIGRGTEVLGENLPQCHFVHHKPYMLCPDANPGRSGGKSATARVCHYTGVKC
jgi:hypothetical protein